MGPVFWRMCDPLVVSAPDHRCHGDEWSQSLERNRLSSEDLPEQNACQVRFFAVQSLYFCHQSDLMDLWGVSWTNGRIYAPLMSGVKSCVCQSHCHGDGGLSMMMSAAVGCTHPQDNTPLEVHRNHGRCAYCAYLRTNGFHCHDVLCDQNGLLAASQTNQSLLGLSDRLFKQTKTNIVSQLVLYRMMREACRIKPCKKGMENPQNIPQIKNPGKKFKNKNQNDV